MSRIARGMGWLWVAMGAVGAAPDPAAMEDPFLALYPELRTAPAPASVRPGLRLTYGGVPATVPSALRVGGLTQVNVVALDAKTAVVEVRTYTFGPGCGVPFLGSCDSSTAPAGSGDGFWMSPDVIKAALGRQVENLRVVRMPYEVGGKAVQAVCFHVQTPAGWRDRYYEEATGLLVCNSSVITGPDGQEMRSHIQLVGRREVAVPWATAPLPAWLTQVNVLGYEGSITLAGFEYLPPMGFRDKLDVTARGANWIRYTQTRTLDDTAGMPSLPTQLTRVAGAAQIGGLWIGPEAAKALRAGQPLDSDPWTGVVTKVIHAGPNANGADVVVITEANAAHSIGVAYDRASGRLLSCNETNEMTHQRIQFRLTRRP